MRKPKAKKYTILSILALSTLAGGFIFASEGEDLPAVAPQPPMIVETLAAQIQNRVPKIPAWGLVEASEVIALRPEVNGTVISLSSDVIAGASVKSGDVLFQISDADYKQNLKEAQAALSQAQQALELEKGQQKIARAEYQLLSKDFANKASENLALRTPQLKEKQAALSMMEARYNRAKLDYERTTLTAPCDGQIMSEEIAVGHYLDKGSVALTLACTGAYHIYASFSPDAMPDLNQTDVHITIGDQHYKGTLRSVLPQIDPQTRRKQALVSIDTTALGEKQKPTLGTYAAVQLQGQVYSDVIAIPKAALRNGNQVWVLDQNSQLNVKTLQIAGQDTNYAFAKAGLKDNEQIILSHIANPLKGMQLAARNEAADERSIRIVDNDTRALPQDAMAD